MVAARRDDMPVAFGGGDHLPPLPPAYPVDSGAYSGEAAPADNYAVPPPPCT